MKEGWIETIVGELVNQKIIEKPLDGNHGEIHPKKSDFTEFGIPFVMASDLVKGAVTQETCNFISREQADSLRKGFAKDGDVLLSHKGTIGRSAILQTSLDYVVLTPQVTYYRILNNSVLDNRFLYYSFHSPKFQSEIKKIAGAGSTRAYIGITQQLQLHIPIAPLDEQKRIVSILDETFERIDTAIMIAEKNLANAHELFESCLNSIFTQKGDGWLEKNIGEVCKLSQGLAINSKTKFLLVPKSSLPLLRITDLRNNTEEQFIAEQGYPANCLVDTEDIIYTRTGNSLGLVFTGRKGVLHNNSFKIVPDRFFLDRRYLFWWLHKPGFKETIMNLASRTAQPDITHKLFNVQPITLPILSVQKESVEKIEHFSTETQRLEAVYHQKIAALKELKQSILQKAFTGELTAATVEKAA